MKVRIRKYQELISNHNTNAEYDPYSWFNEAISEDIKFLDDKKVKFDPIKDILTFNEKYKQSNWYRFQEAAKSFQKRAADKMAPIFSQIEIKEW